MVFTVSEFEARMHKAQSLMGKAGLDAILLTTQPDVFYFTGFLTRFWESPCRPWFVILPQSGKPIAIIPGIGATLMARTWVEDIRTWAAPDMEDDGISLLANTLIEMIGHGRVGIPHGLQSHLRMPLADFETLKIKANGITFTNDSQIIRRLRMVKSQAEIAKIRTACEIAGRAFDRVGEIASAGKTRDEVFRRFQMLCLDEGADWVPYLAGGSGTHGYDDVISPADDTSLQTGDILMLDTGLVHDGYFCDYDRNFAIGSISDANAAAHAKLIDATQAGFEAIKPGRTASEIFHAMDKVLTEGEARNDNGRLGHGLGINLTEWPSLIPDDHTVLEAGMVLTLEPGIETVAPNMMVHEENVVVTKTGAEYLSTPYSREIRIL